MMGESVDADDDVDSAEEETADIIDNWNDVIEGLLSLCPRRTWLVFGDNPEQDPTGNVYCWRPDMCVSFHLKIKFAKLKSIMESAKI